MPQVHRNVVSTRDGKEVRGGKKTWCIREQNVSRILALKREEEAEG
jgi:hypothetical protein